MRFVASHAISYYSCEFSTMDSLVSDYFINLVVTCKYEIEFISSKSIR